MQIPPFTPIPEDGRTENEGRRSTFIDAVVAELKANPGQAKRIAEAAPKSRATPYKRRGCVVTFRNSTGHHADIYVHWPEQIKDNPNA